MFQYIPISAEKRKGQPRERVVGAHGGNKAVQHGQAKKRCKIQRPDPQDAPYVERLNVNAAGALPFPQQQVRDQEGTEQKKDGNTERSDCSNSETPSIPDGIRAHIIHAVETEDTQESKEAKSI